MLLLPPCASSIAAMSAAVHRAQVKSRGPTHSAKERLRTECLARVRENRLSIIAAVREKQSAQHSLPSPQFTPAADEQAAHDVAAASFSAIINSAMAAQRNHPPLSPSSTPDSPAFTLSQQSTASAPSLSPHSRFNVSTSPYHTHTPLSSESAPPTYMYSPSLQPPAFPHSLLQSMPAAAGRVAVDEKDGGMAEESAMSQADYIQLMDDMAHELWSEQQLIESEENLSLVEPMHDGWIDPMDGDNLSHEEVSGTHSCCHRLYHGEPVVTSHSLLSPSVALCSTRSTCKRWRAARSGCTTH